MCQKALYIRRKREGCTNEKNVETASADGNDGGDAFHGNGLWGKCQHEFILLWKKPRVQCA